METQRLHAIAYEVFRTLNGLNPNFMKDTFYRSSNLTHRIGNLCLFPKHYKVLKQKLMVIRGTHMELNAGKH